jgi:hypothetical protein
MIRMVSETNLVFLIMLDIYMNQFINTFSKARWKEEVIE